MKKRITKVLFYVFIFLFCIPYTKALSTSDSIEVDVILFTGQSNMVGRGATKEVGNANNADFSKLDGKIYEYKYLTNTLIEYNEDNNISSLLGETKKICNEANPKYCVITEEWSYPIVAEFAEQYVKLTGRNVVVVPAAIGGRGITYFNPNYVADTMNSAEENLFNFIVKKYNGAISYLENNGYTIGNQFYIMYNGESDSLLTWEKYENSYLLFHNSLMDATSLEFGAIIKPGLNYVDTSYETLYVEYKVGDWQERIANEHADIMIATSKAVELSQPSVVKENFSDRVHFKLEPLKEIATDAAINIIENKNLPITYNIKYNCNGGVGEMVNSVHTYGKEKQLNVNTCKRENYVFKGWTTTSTSTTVEYKNQQSIKDLTNENDKTITFYAVWEPIIYNIKYDCNGGIGEMSEQPITYTEKTQLYKNSCEYENKQFLGWSLLKNSNIINYNDMDEIENIDHNMFLYAVWSDKNNIKYYQTKNEISIFYDKDSFLDEQIELNVKQVDSENINGDIYDLLNEKFSKYIYYDITILNHDNYEVEPTNFITLSIDLPSDYNVDNIAVYRVENGNLIDYEVTIKDNKVVLKTDHFSEYVVGERNVILNPNTGDSILLYIGIILILIFGIILVEKRIKLVRS